MTRINTNVSSLVAQKTLGRNNADLQTSLTRLSTGLRINVGKDDPAGLIASENLRRDIISVEKAVTNSERANQLIATADSALGQVSGLLNDIRGLVTEAANSGVLSDEQIAANQLQVDSSLEAIDRIAQVTTFQGRRLLDGSFDFLTTGSNATIEDMRIKRANLGTAGAMDVDVAITAGATQAEVTTPELVSRGSFTLGDRTFTLTAATAGEDFDGVTVDIARGAANGAAYDAGTKTLTITLKDDDDAIDAADIQAAINGLAEFENTVLGGTGTIDGEDAGLEATALTTLHTMDDLVVQVSGLTGTEVFNFSRGATTDQLVDAINLVSDATGVTAINNGGVLELSSSAYGSEAFVNVEVISEGALGTFADNLSATRATGTDVVARVNGVEARGQGNTLSLNTSTLEMSITVADGDDTDLQFTISGGGAIFQLGPQVVSNQQARIGIESVNTGKLGGASGRLYELRSGGDKSLANDSTGAAKVVDEVIGKITELRGRLGAFQRTTLDTNIASLNDTLANLTEAESAIRDADFAKESAALTRAQILVQSGTSVLSIANQNPQNVLALLR